PPPASSACAAFPLRLERGRRGRRSANLRRLGEDAHEPGPGHAPPPAGARHGGGACCLQRDLTANPAVATSFSTTCTAGRVSCGGAAALYLLPRLRSCSSRAWSHQ